MFPVLTVKTGKWSDMSVKRIPFRRLLWRMSLVNILSISVEVWSVVLVGLLINGKKEYEYKVSTNSEL